MRTVQPLDVRHILFRCHDALAARRVQLSAIEFSPKCMNPAMTFEGANAVASAGMRRGVNLIGDRGAPSRLTTVSHSNFGPSAFVVLSVGLVACSVYEVPNIGAA